MAEFWDGYLWPAIWIVIKILAIVVPLLIGVAYLTYAERKVIALCTCAVVQTLLVLGFVAANG